jgi:pyruvate/2-oxoacid:ferredoxin oxidoreductase beta subunit
MTNVPAVATGVKRYLRRIGRDVPCVIFGGDGLTADVGFQSLSGAAERGENLLYICLDNEAYMNTGIQRSSTTPYASWTTTTPAGKEKKGKDIPLIMAFHRIPYVATAVMSYPEDFALKILKAKDIKDGMAYIHVLCPCVVGWRGREDTGIELGRLAVRTNYFPLWEYERGNFRFTHKIKRPKPISEFTRMTGRFSELTPTQLEHLTEDINARMQTLETLSYRKD